MASIEDLLSLRNTELTGQTGNKDIALSRIDISRFIGENYIDYDSLRSHIGNHKTNNLVVNKPVKKIISYLLEKKLIKSTQPNNYEYYNKDARIYLSGGWLEELIYCAMLETKPDEVLYQQKVKWVVDDITGSNEVDVIARKGDILSFISCKSCHWNYRNEKQSDRNKLRDFLFEADYWDTHFANDKGRAVLVVTQDLIDEEKNNKKRSPTIFARAEVMNVDLVSLDYFEWDKLVGILTNHWY